MPDDVSVIIGTRPEAIKCAPVIMALRDRGITVRIVATGQHDTLFDNALRHFSLHADVNLGAMGEQPDLPGLTARLIEGVSAELEQHRPTFAIVQGDTTTTFAAALSAFYARVPCVHVEAGLRSGRMDAPWPEELNRTLADRICARHYAPTQRAADALRKEGIEESRTVITGQTGVDAVLWTAGKGTATRPGVLDAQPDPLPGGLLYVTAHRRENQAGGIAGTLAGVARILEERPELLAVLPLHPNPDVRAAVEKTRHSRLLVCGPLTYPESVWMLRHAAAVVTDSGGLQEEAPAFGTPVLVTRDVTERPEGVDAGFLRLVGTEAGNVAAAIRDVLDDGELRERLSRTPNPYGDGKAAQRIADDITRMIARE